MNMRGRMLVSNFHQLWDAADRHPRGCSPSGALPDLCCLRLGDWQAVPDRWRSGMVTRGYGGYGQRLSVIQDHLLRTHDPALQHSSWFGEVGDTGNDTRRGTSGRSIQLPIVLSLSCTADLYHERPEYPHTKTTAVTTLLLGLKLAR